MPSWTVAVRATANAGYLAWEMAVSIEVDLVGSRQKEMVVGMTANTDSCTTHNFMSAVDFVGRRVVVTGAASGIGRTVALALVEADAIVFAVDRDRDGLLSLRDQVGNSDAVFVREADLSERDAVQSYSNSAIAHLGQVDGLFNNAGVSGCDQPMVQISLDDWRRVMAINIDSLFLSLKYLSPAMCPGSAVVNTASMLGLVGAADRADYVVSKHAVVGLTRAAAVELAPAGIRVNCICPGPVDTPMMSSYERRVDPAEPDRLRARLERRLPIGRYGRPDEIARLVMMLLAPGLDYLTGAIIPCDGGYTST